MDKKQIRALAEALENDNLSALRMIIKGYGLTPESALLYLWESAGQLIATNRTPRKSAFFDALTVTGEALDSEAIAWGKLENHRRANRANVI